VEFHSIASAISSQIPVVTAARAVPIVIEVEASRCPVPNLLAMSQELTPAGSDAAATATFA
jgi:hypothetical protein